LVLAQASGEVGADTNHKVRSHGSP
jgi:hypothetical protein